MKLSIITAYYKTYLLTKKLIDRLLPQLTDEVEWILIDDGCNETRFDKYKDKIKVIHIKENKGAANSYNTGIEEAKGKYIALVDCDDLVSEDYVKTLISVINSVNYDLIFMDWIDMHSGHITHRPTNIAGWKCIYKRTIMPRFPYDLDKLDVPVHNEIMKDKYTKTYIDKVLYIYNSGRPGSITSMIAEKEKNEARKSK